MTVETYAASSMPYNTLSWNNQVYNNRYAQYNTSNIMSNSQIIECNVIEYINGSAYINTVNRINASKFISQH